MINKLLAVGMFLVTTSSLFAQTEKSPDVSVSTNVTKYVIGIGNEDGKIYNNVLTDLQANSNIKIYAYCERNSLIAVAVRNDEFKSYDFVRDYLLSEYPGIELYRKTENSLKLDCNDQISKQ